MADESREDLQKQTGAELARFGDVFERFPRAPMRQKLWTPAFTTGVALIAAGLGLVAIRLVYGLGVVTNLSDGFPWGIWIAFDVVVGVALAAGGFVTAAIVYVFNQGRYSPLIRPAIITSFLGYAMVALAIVVDVGRWWQIYNPFLPENWQKYSVLFAICICEAGYLLVLLIEFLPTLTDKWLQRPRGLRRRMATRIRPILERVLILFVLLGVLVSCLHQALLGSMMLLMSHRLHALWFTPWLPLLFLLSAVGVGMHVVIVESMMSARTFGRRPEMPLLAGMARRSIAVLGIYVIVKIWDLVAFGELQLIFTSWFGALFAAEMLLFGVIPVLLLSFRAFRRDPRRLFAISWMVIAGLVLNRINVYLFAVQPYDGWTYFPTLWELMVTAMMIAVPFVGYKIMVNYFPVLHQEGAVVASESPRAT